MQLKNALRHNLEKLARESPKDFEGIDINCVKIYLDVDTDPDSVLKIIRKRKNRNKFRLIIRTILQGRYDDALYKKERNNIAAMKFSGLINSRIYCLEMAGDNGEKKIVIMCRGIEHKSSQKNDKKINAIIDSVENSTYIFHETL